MHRFTDNAGRQWEIAVDVPAIKRLRDALQVDLLEVVNEKSETMERLLKDVVLLADVLWCLCQEQAASQGVDAEGFLRAVAGDATEAAYDALLEDLADFFPSRRGVLLRKAMDKLQEIERRVLAGIDSDLDHLDMEKVTGAVLAKLRGNSAGSAPASSASTPDG